MAVDTHCLPTGTDPTGALEPPNFPGVATILPAAGGVGNRRGVAVWLHGLNGPNTWPAPPTGTVLTLLQDLQAAGWTVIAPTLLGDTYGGGQEAGWGSDFATDATFGARFATTQGLWIDHAINYITANYPGWPVMPVGGSGGGYTSLLWASTRTSTIAAYCCQVPATYLWQIAVGPFDYYNLAPKLSFTLASGENGLTLPQSTLTVNETISAQNPPQVGGLLVATGPDLYQQLHYTSWSGSVFSGITGGDGLTAMVTNGTVSQSTYTSGADLTTTWCNALGNGSQGVTPTGFVGWAAEDNTAGYAITKLIGNNAVTASQPVTTYQAAGAHGLFSADVTAIMNWVNSSVAAICPAVH